MRTWPTSAVSERSSITDKSPPKTPTTQTHKKTNTKNTTTQKPTKKNKTRDRGKPVGEKAEGNCERKPEEELCQKLVLDSQGESEGEGIN